MRVLITTDTVGGVWTFTQELTLGLLDQGCAVALFSLGSQATEDQHRWCADTQQTWPANFTYTLTDHPLEWMQSNARAYTDAAPALLRLAADFHPDLLHTNQFCFGALPIAVPTLVTAHSDVLSWAAACRPTPLEPSQWLTQYRTLVQSGLDQADAVAAPTEWILIALNKSFHLPPTQKAIPNGRTIPILPSTSRKLQAITAGRLWDEAKNLTLLTNVNSPIPILIAGESTANQAASPLTTRVQLLGPLPEQALLTLFTQSAVYICPSLYEPFGLAPLEAALCGCAVLAMDIPSLREVWAESALYFTDAPSLTHLLETLAANPTQLATAQAKSHARAERYTRSAITAAYLRLYRDLIASRQPSLSQPSPSQELASVA